MSAGTTRDTSGYRPDIDGLRGYAVLAVLFYHVGFGAFGGGYVGVDVFFVISGFLITRLIRDEVDAGSFRFSTFYIRRIRRLFPALIIVLAVTFLFAYALFSPFHLKNFAATFVSAVFSVSNFYFWTESGYFALDAHFVPLLHTWSLSVEEQFYLIWPAVLFWLLTRKGERWVIMALILSGGLSFALALAFTEEQSMIFYMLPFRIFEFAIGGLLVWLVAYRPRRTYVLEILALTGFLLMAWPMVTYTEETIFPGLNALWPCLGAGLLIYAGQAPRLGLFLNNRLMVGIGLISYSLYLIHWPVIVFYRYRHVEDLTFLDQAAVILISLFLAMLSYRWIEQPFRRGARDRRAWPPARFGTAAAALALLASLPAAGVLGSAGLPGRPEPALRNAVSVDFDAERIKTWRYLGDHGQDAPFQESTTNVLIIGDSHAKDMFNALSLNKERFAGFDFAMLNLDDRCFSNFSAHPVNSDRRQLDCRERTKAFIESPLLARSDLVLVSTKWSRDPILYLPDLKDFLDGRGLSLAILGNTAEFFDVPTLVYKHDALEGLERYVANHRDRTVDKLNRDLEHAAKMLNVPYFDKTGLVCAKDRTRCDVLDRDGQILFFDYGHWTMVGARHFGRKFAETGFIDTVLSP